MVCRLIQAWNIESMASTLAVLKVLKSRLVKYTQSENMPDMSVTLAVLK